MANPNVVGEVYLQVNPLDPGFTAGVQKIINKAEQGSTLKIKANTDEATKSVEQLSNSVKNKLGKSFGDAALEAAGFTAALYTIKATVNGVIAKFANLFDVIAKARAGFNSIIGEYNGEKLLQSIRQFAIASPFVTSQLVQYSQQLLGVGRAANTIVPTLQSVGDIVASVGGDTNNLGSILYALTQIQSIGKLTGQDARQLQNQLVPITRYISEYTGKSIADVKKLQEAGGIASDVVFDAITNQGKKVEGALNASVKTISGAKNVIQDTISNLFQSNPGFQKIFDDIVAAIQGLDKALGDPKYLDPIEAALTAVTSVYQSLKPVIAGFAAFASGAGLQALGIITKIFGGLSDVLDSFPAGTLKIVGAGLAAIVTLKAPLLLVKYATSLQTIAFHLLGLPPLTRAETLAVDTLAEATATSATINEKYVQSVILIEGIDEKLIVTQELLRVSTQLQIELEAEYLSLQSAKLKAIEEQIVITNELTLAKEREAAATAESNVVNKGGVFGKVSKLGGAAAIAGIVGGQALQSHFSQTNTAAQAGGKALEYGGIGLLAGGPLGAAAGVALGATLGYIDASEAKMKAHIEASRKLGEDAANAYLKTNEKLFQTATVDSTTKISDEIESIKKQRLQIDEDTRNFNGLKPATSNAVEDVLSFGQYGETSGDQLTTFFNDQKAAAAGLDAQLKPLTDTYDKLVTPINDTVKALNDAGHADLFFETVRDEKTVKGLSGLSDAFAFYGLTLQDVDEKGAAAIVDIITQIDDLTSAQKIATTTANVYAAALKDAVGISSSVFGAQKTNAAAVISQLNAVEAAKKAAIAVNAPGQTVAEQAASKASYDSAIIDAQEAAANKAYSDSIVSSQNQISAANKRGDTELRNYLTLNKDKLASDAYNAAALQVLTAIINAQTVAQIDNNEAHEKANALAAVAKLSTDVTAASDTYSSGIAAINARGEALTHLADTSAQYAAQSALLDAQEKAGNEAATKASVASRRELAEYIFQDGAVNGQHAKNLTRRIEEQEATARATARQKVFNDTLAGGTEILQYNTTAQEIANRATEKAIVLSQARADASAYSTEQTAAQARILAIRRPDDSPTQFASTDATSAAVAAAGLAAEQRATANLVATRQVLLDQGLKEDNLRVRAITNQIAITGETARTAAETQTLADIERDASIARQNYDGQTIRMLENLQKAQIISQAIYGDQIAKANQDATFIGAIASASSAAAAVATAASAKVVKGDLFDGIIGPAQTAALAVSSAAAAANTLTQAMFLGASATAAFAAGQSVLADVMSASLINYDKITEKVLGLDSALKTISGSGKTAISAIITRDTDQTLGALADAKAKYAAIQTTNATGFGPTAGELAAKAEVDKQQHRLDILEFKVTDDIGVFSSIAAGAHGAIQTELDAAAKTAADKADADLKRQQDAASAAFLGLSGKVQAASDAIVAAADKWVVSIKERTKYETAVSTSRLTKNANRQTSDLQEVQTGLADLRARGLSEAAIKALGLDNVADTKQIRKLDKSSSGDLAALSAAIGTRDAAATDLATSAEDKRTRDNIRDAIIEAAKSLNIDNKVSKTDAAALSAQFNITSLSNADDIATAILAALTSGAIAR